MFRYINNGVYRSGFARSQEAYDKAVGELFEHLNKVTICFIGNLLFSGGGQNQCWYSSRGNAYNFYSITRSSDFQNCFKWKQEMKVLKALK